MKRYLCSLVALGLLVGVTGQGMAQPSYSFTTLDVPGSSSHGSLTGANGINESGQIVGWYFAGSRRHGLLLDNGSYTTLDPPPPVCTLAHGVKTPGPNLGGVLGHGFPLAH